MQNNADTDKIRVFKHICQEHQLKVTPQRFAIFRQLSGLNTHPSADAIYQIVKKRYPNISFDTVNRTLQTFAKIGIVDVVEIFGGPKRFDPNLNNHHHLHCTRCGKVFDFCSRAYDNLDIPDGIDEQFQVISKRVVLKGICKACLKINLSATKKNKPKPNERRKK
jgi:Fur family peroxide stress response transcriptional regulator